MSCLNINEVRLAGRLTEAPELKTTQSGVSVTSFGVAVNRRTKSGEEQKSDFFTVIAWRERAEFVSKYFNKGSAIYIAGALQQRSWTDKNNNKRYAVEVVANDIKFIDSKNDSQQSAPIPESYSAQTGDFEEIGDDEDLPF